MQIHISDHAWQRWHERIGPAKKKEIRRLVKSRLRDQLRIGIRACDSEGFILDLFPDLRAVLVIDKMGYWVVRTFYRVQPGTEPGTIRDKGGASMIIKLSDRDIPATLQEQSAKVTEEWQEFNQAQAGGRPNLDHVAEEAFDLMEALVRWMGKAGIDVKAANRRHIEKMRRRELCGK